MAHLRAAEQPQPQSQLQPQRGEQELDLPALRRALAALGREVQEAQARVVATVEAKHAEFVAASEQVSDLRGAVARLRSDLRSAAVLLGKAAPTAEEAGASAGTDVSAIVPVAESPVPRLRAAVAEHRALKEELRTLEAAAAVLTTMLEAQRKLSELDELTGAARYGDAAELTLEIARSLQSVSARDANAEPAMVRAAKLQYYQKRAILASRLEDALSQLIAFGEGHSAVARRSTFGRSFGEDPEEAVRRPAAAAPTTLQQVWDALQVLDLRSRRLEQLAEHAHRKVLGPLLEVARRLPLGRGLKPSTAFDSTRDALVWKWEEADEDDDVGMENVMPEGNVPARTGGKQAGEKQLAPVGKVLPSLESLFLFIQEHWTGSLTEVYAALGKRLWPPTARALVQHFDTCGRDGGQALERFEAAMLKSGLIKGTEKTLSKHVHQHRHALGEQRRAAVLAEARDALLQEDASLVPVCDEDEPGSVTQLLLGQGGELPGRAPAPAAAPEIADDAVSEKLRHALQEDEGLLRLPQMRVSASAYRLAERLRGLLEEAVAAVGQGHVEVAADLGRLARELLTLFAVLRPYAQKGQLKTSARCCAIFLADCLYLVHVLILFPYTYGKRLPPEQRQLSFFVDLVPQLRRLGENHFFAMLRHHQEQLAAALRPCDLGPGISRDRTFIAAEAALGAAVQQVKLAAQGLQAALPAQLAREVAGVLVGVVCQNLLGKLFGLQHLAPDEVGCVTALFTSVLSMGRQVFLTGGFTDSSASRQQQDRTLEEDVPGWPALALSADLLGSGLPRFLEKRTELSRALKKEEAVKLMQLSWQDEPLTPEEAWGMISGEGLG